MSTQFYLGSDFVGSHEVDKKRDLKPKNNQLHFKAVTGRTERSQ